MKKKLTNKEQFTKDIEARGRKRWTVYIWETPISDTNCKYKGEFYSDNHTFGFSVGGSHTKQDLMKMLQDKMDEVKERGEEEAI